MVVLDVARVDIDGDEREVARAAAEIGNKNGRIPYETLCVEICCGDWLIDLVNFFKANCSQRIFVATSRQRFVRPRQVFQDAMDRIQSMSTIYEQLNNSSSPDRVDLKRYVGDIARRLFGSDAQRVLPGSMLLGGIFALICDDIARVAFAGEVPLGILTSLLGATFFALMMVLQFVLILKFLPETKGRTLEELQRYFDIRE